MILYSSVIYGAAAICVITSVCIGAVSLKFYYDDAKDMK